MKTIPHKIFYAVGGFLLTFGMAGFLLGAIEFSSDWARELMTTSSGKHFLNIFSLVLVFGGGVIGYLKCASAIKEGRMNYKKSLLFLCASIAVLAVATWAGMYIAEHTPNCGNCFAY